MGLIPIWAFHLRVGLDEPCGSLPATNILCFYDFSVNREFSVIYSFLPQRLQSRMETEHLSWQWWWIGKLSATETNGEKKKKKSARSDINTRVITSLRKTTCILSAISVMLELSQKQRSLSMQTRKEENNSQVLWDRNWKLRLLCKHKAVSPLQLPCLTSAPRCALSCVTRTSLTMKGARLTVSQRTSTVVAFAELAGAGMHKNGTIFHFSFKNNPLPFLDLGRDKGRIKSGS